ncbi:unnamed protein product [Ectocarpus sp. CCAP 1310/34]|nr:unnamed protein product [Ectocarpus sp. CCAP 1310/34]
MAAYLPIHRFGKCEDASHPTVTATPTTVSNDLSSPHSSTFLRKYLTDATISREHVRVQAIAYNDDSGDGGSEHDAAAAPSRVRVSVVGSNPVLLVRRKPPGGKSYIHRGQSAVAGVGDGFRFCRGFDKVVRVVTVPQPPPPLSSSQQERAGSHEEGNSGDDGERARDPTSSRSAACGVGGGAREDGSRPSGGLAGGAAIAERQRRGSGESESDVRLGDGQASAAATAAAAGVSRCTAEGAAASVAPAATVAISAKLSGDQGKRSVEGRDESAGGRSDDGEEAEKLNHEEEDRSGGASGFSATAGNVSEGGGAKDTHAPMQEQEEEEEEEEGDGSDRQDGGDRRRRREKEHHQRRRRQRQGGDKQRGGAGAQGSTDTALASRSRDGVSSSSPVAAAAAAATLRVALVGRGFSKNQQEVFRKNGSKLGMEVLVRPEAKVGKPPNLFEASPGATPGKGKKRRRSSGNERHHRMSLPLPPPLPPLPPRQFAGGGGGGGGGSGGGGLLEQLRTEKFAVAVCWSEKLAPWAELLGPTAAERGAEVPPSVGVGMGLGDGGGGRGAGGRGVEVVGHQWLRRVDTRPYLLSPLKKDDAVGAEEEGKEEGGREPAFVVPMYACQRPTPMKHHNHEVTDVLDAMTKMYKVVGDWQRADSFMRLSSVLRFLDRRIRSGSDIRHVHHVGERMVEAVDEILETGTLGRLEELKSHPRNQVCQELMKVHGVGSRTAKDWYNRGIRSVEDARRTLLPNDDDTEGEDKRPNLKPEVVMGLKHFHDMQVVQKRIQGPTCSQL